MSDKEEKALKEWQEELEKEVQKLKGKRFSDEIATIRRKLDILKAMESRIKGDVYGEKVRKQEVSKLEQTLEEKQMQYGRLSLLKKLTDYLEDIL